MNFLIRYRLLLIIMGLLIYSSLIPSLILDKQLIYLNFAAHLIICFGIILFKRNLRLIEKLVMPIIIALSSFLIITHVPFEKIHIWALGFSYSYMLDSDFYSFISNCFINLSLLIFILMIITFYMFFRNLYTRPK